MPGETVLIGTAILAGTTHNLNVFVLVGAAAAGAIFGDNVGFWIVRDAGFLFLVRYGSYARITESKSNWVSTYFYATGERSSSSDASSRSCVPWPPFSQA